VNVSWQGEVFKGKIGFTMEDSTPHWNLPPRPPAGSPNVLMIVLDDVGYGHLGCYGSPIETPNIDALAARGLRYTNWHTTAMCSPTRSCLLTGRNHHSNGMGMISELASGYPGYDGMPKPSRAYISELLQAQGFATFALGKWHQVPAEEMSTAGPYTRWPVGKGFDRYYGFLGAETDQFSYGEIGKTMPIGWSLSGEGLCCGYDSETPVSDLYQSPFKFMGGIERVVVSVSGEPFHIVSKEVENAFIVQ
jgi:hypothetical protein